MNELYEKYLNEATNVNAGFIYSNFTKLVDSVNLANKILNDRKFMKSIHDVDSSIENEMYEVKDLLEDCDNMLDRIFEKIQLNV